MNKVIIPQKLNSQGPSVADLHSALQVAVQQKPGPGKTTTTPPKPSAALKKEQAAKTFGPATQNLVKKFQTQQGIKPTGEVDQVTANALNDLLQAMEKEKTQDTSGSLYQVVGTVSSIASTAIGGLSVVIVDRSINDKGGNNLTQTTTDDTGGYQASFPASAVQRLGKSQPDLQAKVYEGKTLLGTSSIRYNASLHETLDVALDDTALSSMKSEYDVLTSALASQYKGKLGDLQENNTQQDITYLANKTGWDARAVAYTALSDQFSQQSANVLKTASLPAAFFYALFRAGLPANEDMLYQTDANTVETALASAIAQGVIAQSFSNQIPTLVQQFQAVSKQKLLAAPALAGVSTLKDLLIVSRLTDAQQQQFAELYVKYQPDMNALWKAVTSSLGAETANRLQVDGKLSFLTLNNAPLVQKVNAAAGAKGLSNEQHLVQMGYYRAEAWSSLLDTTVPIPKEILGDTPAIKRAKYADYLAAQIRLSYPTAALAEMVNSGELPLTGAAEGVADGAHSFLAAQQGKFEIGVQPIEQYINDKKLDVAADVVDQLKRIQRVYQITPSDQAMIALMKKGVDSAYRVVQYDRETFVQEFAADMGGTDSATATYDRAVLIHNTVVNVVVGYLYANTAPPIGVHSPAGTLDPTPANTGDVLAGATLETLFGSTDFCSCEHCRSILSPAAYLVDLLDFLNPDVPQSGTQTSPFDVLMSRRPDIQYLPLTCENTNTELPYIDVVNETLEFFIANSTPLSLTTYQGHDTGSASSDDLIAAPQTFNDGGIRDAAYKILEKASFPAPLPFHQPLENLRRYFNKLGVSLSLAMTRLRKTDDLERGANTYGWRDIRMEELGLSRAENDLLTTSTAAPMSLWKVFGFPENTSDSDIINGTTTLKIPSLTNAKLFSHRIGISYDDLVDILQTRFVNPSSDLIKKIERLGVSFTAIQNLKDAGNSGDAAFTSLLPTGVDTPDATQYGGDITTWVQNHYDDIMSLIVLVDPTGSGDACNFEQLELRHAKPPANTTDTSTRIGAVEFIRLLRFVRLWQKTGWTIDQTDAAICALYHTDFAPIVATDINTLTNLDNGFQILVPRLGIVQQVMQVLDLTVDDDLLPLLACWSDISTNGNTSLYATMFLNPTLLKQDPVFGDNGYGEFLKQTPPETMLLPGDSFQKAVIGGDVTTGDMLTTAINSVPVSYPVASTDKTVADLATKIVAAINNTATTDSTTGLPLNQIVNASTSTPGVITITTSKPGTSFTLVCSVSTGATETYSILSHAPAVRSAFNLTGEEFALIIASLPETGAVDRDQNKNLLLTLRNLSAIFRRGWLARKLAISVRELLLFVQLTGLDPFASADPTQPAMLRLISFVQALQNQSLSTAVALYLMWNQDLSGKSAPDPAQVAGLARTLRLGFASVENDFRGSNSPDASTVQALMATVYGPDTASLFFSMLNDTLTVSVDFPDPNGTLANTATWQAIQSAAGETQAGTYKISYDDFSKKLSYSGPLDKNTRDAIKTAAGAGATDFDNAVDQLYSQLYDNTTGIITIFFVRYPELEGPFQQYIGDIADTPTAKLAALLQAMLPTLVTIRKQQQALQSVSAVTTTPPILAQTLLSAPAAPYPLHALGDVTRPALDDFLALETPGLSVQFFANDTASGTEIKTTPNDDIASSLTYAPVGNALPANTTTPGAPISGIWSGYLEAPENGNYNIYINTDAGATVTLLLNTPVTLSPPTSSRSFWTNTDELTLKAGTLYPFTLTVEKTSKNLQVQWDCEPKDQGRTDIPAKYLYPESPFDAFQEAYIRFLKAASLATGLSLTANELNYFAVNPDYWINNDTGNLDPTNGQGWLNVLPDIDNLHLTDSAQATIAKTLNAVLLIPLQALLDFARIKAAISPSDESLLSVLQNPAQATQSTDGLLYTMTRWNPDSLMNLLTHFGDSIVGLAQFSLFQRVYDAFTIVQGMGISANALIGATTNEPQTDTVRAMQAALRALYDLASWRDVVQPINDEMRKLQRDALVAYILQQMQNHTDSAHIDTPEKLFEYFLMDVEMDPCMLTSRVRHALSSLQIFIERCMMNLEPTVSPSFFDDTKKNQWKWMKRYRVWEANRKVYLWPENWLVEALRDNQSPFCKETMSELLQSDITDDRAEIAMLNYLAKLDEVAKLEVCGVYCAPTGATNPTDMVVHVVARTAGIHRKYYYRRLENASWTPWEQIKQDIEDNPVIPVVWNSRLLLFWLRILKHGPTTPDVPVPSGASSNINSLDMNDVSSSATKNSQVTVTAMLCWSEYYNGKWQATRTSDANSPLTLDNYTTRDSLRLRSDESQEEQLAIIVVNNDVPENTPPAFVLYNTHSLPDQFDSYQSTGNTAQRNLNYHISQTSSPGNPSNDEFIIEYSDGTLSDVLGNPLSATPVQSLQSPGSNRNAPFFYEDKRNVFYVTTQTQSQWVSNFQGYGVATNTGYKGVVNIPPIYTKKPGLPQHGPDPRTVIGAGSQQWVTAGANIRQGLALTNSVSYDGSQIGPSGAITNTSLQKG